jgi:hypothetical protein
MNIGSAMIENVPEANPAYVGVAEKYDEDVIGVPEAFTNFLMSGFYPRKPRCITPYFSVPFLPLQRMSIF